MLACQPAKCVKACPLLQVLSVQSKVLLDMFTALAGSDDSTPSSKKKVWRLSCGPCITFAAGGADEERPDLCIAGSP